MQIGALRSIRVFVEFSQAWTRFLSGIRSLVLGSGHGTCDKWGTLGISQESAKFPLNYPQTSP